MERSFSSTAAEDQSVLTCLTCYLCGELFRRPRILPCGHTFCSECLARLKDDIVGDSALSRRQMQWESYTDSCDTTDFIKSPDSLPPKASHGHSSPTITRRESDNSTNVDYLHSDVDSNGYRPISSNKNPYYCYNTDHEAPNGMPRSSTFSRDQFHSTNDRSPSRFSAPAGSLDNVRPCNNCGQPSSSTLPRRGKTSQKMSSFRDKSPKYRDGHLPTARWDSSPQRTSVSQLSAPACSFEHRHGKEMEPFVCPLPECNYSLRVMNLARWSPRNKAVSDVIGAWRRRQQKMKDAATQTDISTDQSLLVTIPRSLIDSRSLQPLGQRRRHSSMVDMAIDSAVSMDSLERGYIPRGHMTWRSYAAVVGMNILHQIVNL